LENDREQGGPHSPVVQGVGIAPHVSGKCIWSLRNFSFYKLENNIFLKKLIDISVYM
jgi:hypothetical protein